MAIDKINGTAFDNIANLNGVAKGSISKFNGIEPPSASGIVTNNLLMHLDAGNANSYPGSGTAWTDLISDNDATLKNGVGYSSSDGGHLVLDGTNDYIDANIFTIPARVTVSVWLSADHFGSTQQILTSDASPIRNWQFRIDGNAKVRAIGFHTSGSNNIQLVTTSTLSANTWTQVSMTIDGTNMKIYFNGVQQATTSFAHDILGNGSTGDTAIGIRLQRSPRDFFDGKIAVALVYSEALSATELTQNYNALQSRFS
jgi:hypothetical protein